MITNATIDSVSILEVRNEINWRRAYSNSEEGRAQLQVEFPEAYAELCGEDKLWGTEPIVFPAPETEPIPTEPTVDEILNALLGVTE